MCLNADLTYSMLSTPVGPILSCFSFRTTLSAVSFKNSPFYLIITSIIMKASLCLFRLCRFYLATLGLVSTINVSMVTYSTSINDQMSLLTIRFDFILSVFYNTTAVRLFKRAEKHPVTEINRI